MSFNMPLSLNQLKKKHQTGAVLLAVLVVALALVMLLGVVSKALNNRIIIGQQGKDSLQDAALVYGKLNELSYLLATQRVTAAGLSTGTNPQGNLRDDEGHWMLSVIGDEIRTDGFMYKLDNQLQYSIQNEAGLIAINSASQFWLKQALASYGLTVVEQAKFADILADYADSDDWRRPAGAESFAYKKANKPVPRNYLLQSCSELFRLELWSDWLAKHSDWLKSCSINRTERLNINSVPLVLWQKLWPDSAQKLVQQREQKHWLLNTDSILALEPSILLFDDVYYSISNGNQFNIAIRKNGVHLEKKIKIGNNKAIPFIFSGGHMVLY